VSPVAVVTGASRGIGRAVAIEAADRGFDVLVCCGTATDAAHVVADQVRERGRRSEVFSGDLAEPPVLPALCEAARRLGPVALLVNNAGATHSGPLDELDLATWERALALNLTAPVWLAKLLAPDLAANEGVVVNIGSTGGIVGSVHSLPYAATKAGLMGATKTLARMLAPAVRVNLVAPGITDTDLLDGITDAQRAEIIDGQPLRRLGDPEEIARVVLDVAGWTYATGQTVVADGGRVM
jgi:3-oxoacyl-[acyl-carrier protein] reductase